MEHSHPAITPTKIYPFHDKAAIRCFHNRQVVLIAPLPFLMVSLSLQKCMWAVFSPYASATVRLIAMPANQVQSLWKSSFCCFVDIGWETIIWRNITFIFSENEIWKIEKTSFDRCFLMRTELPAKCLATFGCLICCCYWYFSPFFLYAEYYTYVLSLLDD